MLIVAYLVKILSAFYVTQSFIVVFISEPLERVPIRFNPFVLCFL
jgi:hypothetical protein